MPLKLTEDRREQLDSIVQKMIGNKETDGNIQFVVDDFKTKYGFEEPTKQPRGLATGVPVGFGKGVLSTIRGAASLGERGFAAAGRAVLPRSAEKVFGIQKEEFQPVAEQMIPEELVRPEGAAEKAGFFAERIAEFLVPSAKIAKLQKGLKLLPRAGTEAAIVGGQAALQQGKLDSSTIVASLVGGMFPVAGRGLGMAKGFLKPVGEKIQMSVVRPTAKDLADGFDIKNVSKHKVGGALKDTVTKTHVKLNELSQQLQENLKEVDELVDLKKVAKQTEEVLQKGRGRDFGNIRAVRRVLEGLREEIKEVSKTGKVDLVEATNVKRGAGTKGSWAFGRPEPDSNAIETVYTKFYQELKKDIENKAPEGLKSINKEISELIPISNAALRRLPVDQRNNIISLTESIGLFSAMFNPQALAVVGANKLAKSGKFGQFLVDVASKTKKRGPIRQRIFGE